jgi:hypothetical protein
MRLVVAAVLAVLAVPAYAGGLCQRWVPCHLVLRRGLEYEFSGETVDPCLL